jgi:hypothetical protein
VDALSDPVTMHRFTREYLEYQQLERALHYIGAISSHLTISLDYLGQKLTAFVSKSQGGRWQEQEQVQEQGKESYFDATVNFKLSHPDYQ